MTTTTVEWTDETDGSVYTQERFNMPLMGGQERPMLEFQEWDDVGEASIIRFRGPHKVSQAGRLIGLCWLRRCSTTKMKPPNPVSPDPEHLGLCKPCLIELRGGE